MAINKKFIHFKRKSTFQRELEAGNILNTSIVFIADAKQIYLNGSYFSENTLFNLSDLLSTVSGDLTDTDTSNEAIVKLYKQLKELDTNTNELIKILIQELSTLEETLTDRIDNTDLLVATELNNINQKLDNLVNTTYSELKSLRDSSKLISGRWYRITDYECATTQENTRSAGHQFDILVLATSEGTLSEEARAIRHEGDTYFQDSNLNAWKIWYTLDNDTAQYGWADAENGKGVIYRMIDEFQNDCPYDFKNILFNDYEGGGLDWYTFSIQSVEDSSIFDISLNQIDTNVDYKSSELCQNNTISSLVLKIQVDDSNYLDKVRYLNNIVLQGRYDRPYQGIEKYQAPCSNFFGLNCGNIKSYYQIKGNNIQNCGFIIFVNYCCYSTLTGLYYCTIGDCRYSTILEVQGSSIRRSNYSIINNCGEIDCDFDNSTIQSCHWIIGQAISSTMFDCDGIYDMRVENTQMYHCMDIKSLVSYGISSLTSNLIYSINGNNTLELNIPKSRYLTICTPDSNGEIRIYNPADHLSNVIAEEVASTSLEDTSTVSREEYENLLQRVIALENG